MFFYLFCKFFANSSKVTQKLRSHIFKLSCKTSDVNSKMEVAWNIGSFAQKNFLILCKILIEPRDV